MPRYQGKLKRVDITYDTFDMIADDELDLRQKLEFDYDRGDDISRCDIVDFEEVDEDDYTGLPPVPHRDPRLKAWLCDETEHINTALHLTVTNGCCICGVLEKHTHCDHGKRVS